MMSPLPKVIAVLGPTASGKSDLAVTIARAIGGEVVSADSRQVYRGLDIGTGKVTKREMRGVPHHLLDVASPAREYSLAQYLRDAHRAINDILRRGKVPIICGGTGLYLDALLDGVVLPDVPPNPTLRATLARCTPADLFAQLELIDPERATTIDAANPRRLIRAIEIATALGRVPPQQKKERYDVLRLGIQTDPDELRARIHTRLDTRLRRGMIAEVRRLHEHGLSWKRMDALGLEYRFLGRFLSGKIDKATMRTDLANAISAYARRQRTWWRKDTRIMWLDRTETDRAITLAQHHLHPTVAQK